jgi:Pyruvate/2-oxoacid:ferredoxin oxidoreductase gamma subunit
MLGAYVAWSGIVEKDVTIGMIEKEFARKAKFIPANVAAFKAGYDEGYKLRGDS